MRRLIMLLMTMVLLGVAVVSNHNAQGTEKTNVKKVLCIRIEPENVSEKAKMQFRSLYGNEVKFELRNPMTAEELDTMSQEDGVMAIYLQERPLPTIVVQKGKVPCALLSPDGKLVRLVSVKAEFAPLEVKKE